MVRHRILVLFSTRIFMRQKIIEIMDVNTYNGNGINHKGAKR